VKCPACKGSGKVETSKPAQKVCDCGYCHGTGEQPDFKPMNGVQLIAAERTRQIEDEKWSPAHDDRHKKFQLSLAASSYIAVVASPDEWAAEHGTQPAPCHDWPWAKKWWKPSDDPIRNLVKAGALIAAEIDRLQRAQAKGGKS